MNNILRQINKMKEHNLKDDSIFAAYIQEKNLLQWRGYIEGPPQTIWEGGVFRFLMTLPKNYPNSPPKFHFTSQIFHPNIYGDGTLCISIQRDWKCLSIDIFLTSVQSMLSDPNPSSPANKVAADLLMNNRKAYELKVSQMVKKSLQEPIDEMKE